MSPLDESRRSLPVAKVAKTFDISPKVLSTSATANGLEYYRSIEHLAGSPEVAQYIEQEFPSLSHAIGTTDRRQFLRFLGASMALAGITSTGCRRWPVEEVRPHTSRPEGFTPGVAEHYATSLELDGISTGILAKSYDGRPIKIEGNPDHPFSLGAASAFAQASVLELYDPDRSRSPKLRERESTWQRFQNFAITHFQALRHRQGDGLAFLIQPTGSPTFARLRSEFEAAFPKARWFEYQPLHRDNEFAGSLAALGRILRPQYDLQQASTVVTFDADLLGGHPASLRHARDWSAGRRSVDSGSMNRLVAIEPSLTITGSAADIRLPLKPTLVEKGIAYVAYRFGILSTRPSGLSETQTEVLENAAIDLKRAGADGLVVVGPALGAASHQLAHAINQEIGAVGHGVSYTEEPLASAKGSVEQIADLSDLLQGNVLSTLVIVGGNPVYDAPADAPLNLVSDDRRPLTSIHLSLHEDETSKACTWHLPTAHFLESWGDGRAWDGTYTLQQPLILPLYDGKSPIELLAILSGQSAAKSLSLVRATFDKQFEGATQQDWERALHAGVKSDSAFAIVDPPTAKVDSAYMPTAGDTIWEIRFAPDVKTHDGRFANNAWLQELPEPLTKLTWDNAALISPSDAKTFGLEMGDVVRLSRPGFEGEGKVAEVAKTLGHSESKPKLLASSATAGEASIEVPICILPGHASGCITLPLGYGRTAAGHIGNQVGFNVYPLRSKQSSYFASDCTLTKTGDTHELVTTQVHDVLDAVAESAKLKRLGERGKPGMIVHETLFADYQHDHHSVHGDAHPVHAAPLFDLPHSFDSPHRWGMSIDLNACIGCSGCVVACQAENNIPVVGKANVAVNREMHWLRIDRYYKGDIESPDVVYQPMACAHCENAPCEQVCPVAATVHDSEGLNAMIYNRCIGTRYCANNCPFKVRRFNYFDYQASDPRTPAKPWVGLPDQQQTEDVSTLKKMVHNPEVTVRMRGVMEKCTYCVQRIVDARIHAKNENALGLRESDLVAEGEVQTACQVTCPTQAIVFGDLNDPESAVSKARVNARSYEVLEGNNLGARTTYLAKIRNRET